MKLYLAFFFLLTMAPSQLPHAVALTSSAQNPVSSSALANLIDESTSGAAAGGKDSQTGSQQISATDRISQYQPAVDAVATAIIDSNKQNADMLKKILASVGKEPAPLINKEAFQKILQEKSLKSEKAGTRSISLQADQGFNGFSNYQPSGWVMTETVSGPTNKIPQTTEEKSTVYTYPKGVGPVLLNGCTAQSYSSESPCNSSRLPGQENEICLNLLDAAAYVGVGFDGRGFYNIDSRRASLVQRICSNQASFLGKDVPDTMNVFGIFETTAETKSFQSASEYMSYIREKAGLSKQKNLFLSESSKHSSSSAGGFNLGAIAAIGGAVIGAATGGPIGAAAGTQLGSAAGGSVSIGAGSGSGGSSSTDESESRSRKSQTDDSNSENSASRNFFAIMYVSITLYEITLDDVKPQDIKLAALKDYMSLPESYYTVGSDVKYQNFLLRWGTHFIRSGKFGGQLKIIKTAKMNKVRSVQEFASIAETEFQSMFASLQSKYSQKSTKSGFFGFGKEKKSSNQKSSAESESEYESTMKQKNQLSQSSSQSEFTQTTVEAQGGTPEIAEALVDFYTPSFKALYHRWIVSINDYVKPFEFQLKSIDQLFNMNMDDLFPAGNLDFGCLGSAGTKVKIYKEPETKRRYYLDKQTKIVKNHTITTMVVVYCKYSDLEDFKNNLERRRISLEKSIAAYMAEGPFPTSSHELEAGQPGCEKATLAQINIFRNGTQHLTFAELKKAPFLIAFDLPRGIPNLLKTQAKYKITYRGNRWFASEPGQEHAHLYDGCQLEGYKPAETKICIWNIILTYEEKSGFFHIDRKDFYVSKRRNPILPVWLSGSTVARASRLDVSGGPSITEGSVPCNVKWMNSHRLDPNKEENCLHFTAATGGDIFVIFASIPRDHTTWYYLQINMEGVAFYKAMKLQKRDFQKGMGTLGNKNLYQSYFVCVNQANGSVLIQFGKADSMSDVGTVYSGYKFHQDSQYSRLSFYTFGAGSKSVSLMDIRLTKQMPKVECLNRNYKLVDGHCILDCHKECIDCNLANDDTSCFHCRNLRVALSNFTHGIESKTVQCLPECPRGYLVSDKAEKLCVPCSPGSFKNSTGNQKCTSCAPGTFSRSGAVECTKCSPGTFSDKSGSTKCQKCSEGTSTSFNGSTSCAACRPGAFSLLGQAQCTPCPVGQFNNETGRSRCQPCSAGLFAPISGKAKCEPCPTGTSSAEGSASCENNCKKGEFSPAKGIACIKCPTGHFTPSAGSTSCILCPAGSFQASEGQSSCTVASAGSYVPGIGANSSIPCPMGSANPFTGKSSLSDCVPCAAGSFSNYKGSTACVPCPKGRYQPLTNQTECRDASPGMFVDFEGQSVQKACPPGKISSVAGAAACTSCSAGRFAGQIGLKFCSKCRAGSWSGSGAAVCEKCIAGTVSADEATTCNRCLPGSFASKNGSTYCGLCSPGSWSSFGYAHCMDCVPGSYTNKKGSMACSMCLPGQWSSAGSTNCSICAAGTYSSSVGSGRCFDCLAGKWSSSGSSSCSDCKAGSYSSSGSSSCWSCPAGKWSNSGSSSCSDCKAGSFSSSGSSSCSKCPAGKWSNSLSSRCSNCPAGTYSSSGSSSCSNCPAGTWSSSGSSSCSKCPRGTYSKTQRSSSCSPCKAGFYAFYSGQDHCEPCRSGTFSSGGQHLCTKCPAGEFSSSSLVSTECIKCPAGQYSKYSGSSNCRRCPSGTYSSSRGSTGCTACKFLKHAYGRGNTKCTVFGWGK